MVSIQLLLLGKSDITPGLSSLTGIDILQIPAFIPFFACFFGALTYDVFIYTGDSPLNNGSWSLANFRKAVTPMWDNILVGLGRGPRRDQSDEESQGAEQTQETPTSKSLADNEGCKSSSSSPQGNDERESGKHEEEGTNEPNENTGSESNHKLKKTRKAGYHGEAWEKTASESRHSQKTGDKRKGHEERNQKMRQPANDTETQERQADQNFGGKTGKQTGYDDPDPDRTEKDVGEKVDEHGDEN